MEDHCVSHGLWPQETSERPAICDVEIRILTNESFGGLPRTEKLSFASQRGFLPSWSLGSVQNLKNHVLVGQLFHDNLI